MRGYPDEWSKEMDDEPFRQWLDGVHARITALWEDGDEEGFIAAFSPDAVIETRRAVGGESGRGWDHLRHVSWPLQAFFPSYRQRPRSWHAPDLCLSMVAMADDAGNEIELAIISRYDSGVTVEMIVYDATNLAAADAEFERLVSKSAPPGSVPCLGGLRNVGPRRAPR